MGEYVDRKALESAMTMAAVNGKDRDRRIWAKAICILHDMPTADVATVRHGQWVEKEKYTFGIMCDCSLCENRILDNGHIWNYCPNCGAKMDMRSIMERMSDNA